MNDESIFSEALQRPTPEARAAFLDAACAGDAALRRAVEVLLRAHERAGAFLEAKDAGPGATVDEPVTERPGTVIGPYKLLEQIGEGGMGSVWMAEQQAPVRRLVALKVIKAGMDSAQVIARFEAERQALALMDHPHIAKVFDGGTTATGRPFFVMELVKGTPITKYCDEHRLTPRQRLELFVPVCQAIHHAHQKGIIHRDVKPSNVLVAPYDGKPVVKVIDFGVAKATGQRLTERTLFTGFGAVVGTLEYMSPEQAELNNQDIDTRSDLYSLGVLLYELLTGTTPLTKERLKQAAFTEMLRIIREEEPPRPSTRLSSSDTLPAIAAARQTEPAKLTKLVRGELDWIVMKALEKDRNRRYETASALAGDMQRYLHDEPVLACPPSASYRLRKFARRNKTTLAVACLILIFVVLLAAGGGWVAFDRAARRAKASQDLELALQRAELYLGQGKLADARAALEQAERIASESQPDPARNERLAGLRQRLEAEERDQQLVAGYEKIRLQAVQVDVVKSKFTRQSAFPEIRELFRQNGIPFVDTPVEEAAAFILSRPEPVRHQLVAAVYDAGLHAPADGATARDWLVALLETADKDPWRMRIRKAMVARNWQAIEQLLRAVDIATQPPGFLVVFAETIPAKRKPMRLDLLRRIQRAYPADLAANLDLGWELIQSGRHGEAIRYYTAALALRPENPGIYVNRGKCLEEVKETDAAIADYERSLALAPSYFTAFANLSQALKDQGRLQDALAVDNRAVEACPDRAGAWSNRANVYNKLGEYQKAIADSTRAIKLDDKLAAAWANRGGAYRALDQYDNAIADCTKAIELDEKNASALAERGNSYLQRGEHKKALADCDRSIELNPTDAFTWYTRGAVYLALGEHEKALANCVKAVELAPKNPWTHANLADVLMAMDRAQDVIAALRKAIAINPDIPEFHNNLGFALETQGEFREALQETRRAYELRSKRLPGTPDPSDQRVRRLERLVELEERLPAFVSGKTKPTSPEEQIELAEICARKGLNRAAARFYDEAFTPLSPRTAPLIGAHRYNAACVAALAGCGRGKDADKPDDKEREQLRRQALDWLRGHLGSAGRLLDKTPDRAPGLARELKHWLEDADFNGVRGREALAKLPEGERQAWQKLWADVADMLKRAQEKAAAKKKADTK